METLFSTFTDQEELPGTASASLWVKTTERREQHWNIYKQVESPYRQTSHERGQMPMLFLPIWGEDFLLLKAESTLMVTIILFWTV